MRCCFVVLALVLFVIPANAAEPQWIGQGRYRVVVEIPPQEDGREGDERPVEVGVDFVQLLKEAGRGRLPDLSTVQVVRHDVGTGEPLKPEKFAFAQGEYDIPWRWYDAAIPYDFPEVERAVSYTKEKLIFTNRPRFGYFYHAIGDGKSGRIVFPHRRRGSEAARYAVYFDLLPAGEAPTKIPPRGFIGDGLQRCVPDGPSTTGLIHSRVETVDYNGDGLIDLLVGCGRGGLVWYPNLGTKTEPKYPISHLVFTTDGKPLDGGWSNAPKLVDWDADGLFDLLVGTEWNRVLLFRNRGEAGKPAFEYAGPLKTDDGELLTLPISPVDEKPGVFKRDYYPVMEMVDWDDDGDLDLLAGGYITGRIYLYENLTDGVGVPRLKFAGPIEADGGPIDVGWTAAPTVADFDNDGDLDLISGCMPRTAGGGDDASSGTFLYYFRNDGSRAKLRLQRVPIPITGKFPRSALGTPRAVDFNGDGLLDLVVSAYTKIFLYENIGKKNAPRFAAHSDHLPCRWGNAPLAAVQFLDVDGDGLLDGAKGPAIYPNLGQGSPGLFGSPRSLLKPGQEISHLAGIGDDWRFQRLFDLDADGRIDLMDADHGGHIWWHKNNNSTAEPDFETEGARLNLTTGAPIQVGLGLEGFEKLQGARATYTVGDFDGDGRQDLVVADTRGIVRYFRQADSTENEGVPSFEPPVQIGKLRIRAVPFATDWNGDGRLDVVAGSSADDVMFFAGVEPKEGRDSPFAEPEPIKLPGAPYGAGAPLVVTDYNNDGDPDILLHTAYGYTVWFERSFIESGYVRGKVVTLETR